MVLEMWVVHGWRGRKDTWEAQQQCAPTLRQCPKATSAPAGQSCSAVQSQNKCLQWLWLGSSAVWSCPHFQMLRLKTEMLLKWSWDLDPSSAHQQLHSAALGCITAIAGLSNCKTSKVHLGSECDSTPPELPHWKQLKKDGIKNWTLWL